MTWLAISLRCVSFILPVSVSPLPGRHFVVGVLIYLNLKNFTPGRVLGLLRGVYYYVQAEFSSIEGTFHYCVPGRV